MSREGCLPRQSYFPIKIVLTKTGEIKLIRKPSDLPSGRYKIVQINVR